jgi:hypothetical protein
MKTNEEAINYRGEKIVIMGNGYSYASILWPKLAMVHAYIDNKLDGTKKDIIGIQDYFDNPKPPKIKWKPNENRES